MTTFIFPSPIRSLAFEVAERTFFAASSGPEGYIYQGKLYRQSGNQGNTSGFEALGGGGTGEALRFEENSRQTITVGYVNTPIFIYVPEIIILYTSAYSSYHSSTIDTDKI